MTTINKTTWIADPDAVRAEWVRACQSPPRMRVLGPLLQTDRLRRLFAVACCRDIYHLFTDERSRTAITVAERYADGLASKQELDAAADAAAAAADADAYAYAYAYAYATADAAADAAADAGAAAVDTLKKKWRLQGEILISIAGPGSVFNTEWRTNTTISLARIAYDGHQWDVLPILADALQDAGCDNEGVLSHLRAGGPYCRGMWILDRLLGKRD